MSYTRIGKRSGTEVLEAFPTAFAAIQARCIKAGFIIADPDPDLVPHLTDHGKDALFHLGVLLAGTEPELWDSFVSATDAGLDDWRRMQDALETQK